MPHLPKLICALLVLVLQVSRLNAQAEAGKLKLYVGIKGKGSAIGRVEITQGAKVFFTDPAGQVEIPLDTPPSALMLKAHGYETLFLEAKDYAGKSELKVYLKVGEPDDDLIIIRGTRREEVSKKSVSVEETARIAPAGDPVQIIKLLPGVQTTNPIGNEVVIRGAGPNDSKYFVDQLKYPQIFHRIGNISYVPEPLLTEVDFYSGGFGPQYGDATGGVIQLRTTTEIPEKARHIALSNVPFYSSYFYEKPLSESSSFTSSLRLSTVQWILPFFLKKENDTIAVPYFGDALARYLHKTEDGYGKLTTFYSSDGLSLAVPAGSGRGADEDGRVKFEFLDQFFIIGYERYKTLGGGLALRTTPQSFYATTDFDTGANYFSGKFCSFTQPVELIKRMSKRASWGLGLDYEISRAKIDLKSPRFNRDDPFFDIDEAEPEVFSKQVFSQEYSAWTYYDLELGDFIASPGLRFFYNSLIKKSGVDPRLNVRYEFSPELALKSAVGLYSIAPEPQESAEGFGNPDLNFETARHYILGVERRFGDRWTLELQGFQNEIRNLIRSDAEKRFIGEGIRLTRGVELFIRRNMTERTFGWLSYTYSRAQEKKQDSDTWRASEYDQTHNVNLAAAYKFTQAWELGTRIKYLTGKPYTKVSDSYYNAGTNKYRPLKSQSDYYDARLPASQSTDLFATYKIFKDTWSLTQRFGLQGIAFGKQVLAMRYSYDYSKEEPVTGIPPIPFYEIKGEF